MTKQKFVNKVYKNALQNQFTVWILKYIVCSEKSYAKTEIAADWKLVFKLNYTDCLQRVQRNR